MRIVVIGSGPGGIGAAAPLAAAGHRVTVVERDSEPPGDDDEAWESWERRSVPQMRHPHFFLARLWREMSDMAPDLRAELEACDPYVLRFADRVPPTTPDADALRADRELVAMGFRRPTFERAMWSWLRRQANIDVRSGAAVRALVSESGSGVPRVRGVVLEDDTVIDADIVVAATGRHGAAVRWLHETGAGPVEEEEADAGLAYFSRFYRLAPGATIPQQNGALVVEVGSVNAFTFPADQGTFTLAITPLADDAEMRKLNDNEAFDQLHVVVVAINCQIVFAVNVDLDFEEGFEVLDVTVVCSKKLGDTVADPNTFLHP